MTRDFIQCISLFQINLAQDSVLDNFRIAGNDIQWGTQLMGHDAQEFVFDFVGFFKVNSLLFRLFVELRVLNRSGSLSGKRTQEVDFFVTKVAIPAAIKRENPEHSVVSYQGHAEIGNETVLAKKVGVRTDVGNLDV